MFLWRTAYNFHVEGFIDFIVEPSFQVMSDIVDKILEPIQQERQKHASSAHTDPKQRPVASANQGSLLAFPKKKYFKAFGQKRLKLATNLRLQMKKCVRCD